MQPRTGPHLQAFPQFSSPFRHPFSGASSYGTADPDTTAQQRGSLREPRGRLAAFRISGLIDAERAFCGNSPADFVSLTLFADIEQETALLADYGAGGQVELDQP
jgi:hypothetical protein